MSMLDQSTSAASRPRTPARPLYAARLPPIRHPLGAPDTPRVENTVKITGRLEPMMSAAATGQVPKIRPTTARPIGTQLSAKTSMAGSTSNSLKPLPGIGEPNKKQPTKPKNAKTSPFRLVFKYLMVVVFLSIPVLIFIIMMIISEGFVPSTEEDITQSSNVSKPSSDEGLMQNTTKTPLQLVGSTLASVVQLKLVPGQNTT